MFHDKNKLEKINMSLNSYSLVFNNNLNSEYTYLSDDDLNYAKPNDKVDKNIYFNYLPADNGIIDYENFKFLISSKKHGFKINLCEFKQIPTTTKLNIFSIRNLNLINEELKYCDLKNDLTRQMLEDYEQRQKELIKEDLKIIHLQDKLINLYKIFTDKNNIIKLTDLQDGQEFKIYAFKNYKENTNLMIININNSFVKM